MLVVWTPTLTRDPVESRSRTGRRNIVATKGSGSPKILLCGHMDTVPGKIKVRKEGDYLYGRGASDAKAPLMAML